jgi:hypothetical protein
MAAACHFHFRVKPISQDFPVPGSAGFRKQAEYGNGQKPAQVRFQPFPGKL